MSAVGGISITQGISIAQASGGAVSTSTSFAPTSLTTNGAGTVTAAGIASAYLIRTGLSAAAADTTGTGAAIFSAVTGAVAGQTFQFTYVNLTPYIVTFTAGSGVTFSGTSGAGVDAIAPFTQGIYQVNLVSSTAVTMTKEWVTLPTVGSAPQFVPTSLTTNGAGTVTAAGIASGHVVRTGLTAAVADTTATGTQIFAAVPGATAGQTFEFTYINTTAYAVTFTSGSGVTFSGTLTGTTDLIPAGMQATYQVTLTSSSAVAMAKEWATLPSIAKELPLFAPDTISTNGAGTITAANVLNGVIRTGLSDGVTDTSPTAALLWAAVPNASAGQTFMFNYVNTTGFPVTMTGSTGVTLSDTVQAGNQVVYQVTLTSSSAATFTRAWSIAAGT